MHPFEKSGLGQGPYRYLGCESREKDVKGPDGLVHLGAGGTTCDHCGTYIYNVCWFRNGEGSKFKVGVDCALKAERKYDEQTDRSWRESNTHKLQAAKKAIARKVRKAREERKLEELTGLLECSAELMDSHPHPKSWAAAKGLTWNDYAGWMMKNSGTAGKLKLLKELKGLAS